MGIDKKPEPLDISKRPQPGKPGNLKERLERILGEGTFTLPGQTESRDLVGVDPAKLKTKAEEHQALMERLRRDINSTWKCAKCKKETKGGRLVVRIVGGVWATINGVRELIGGTEMLVCPEPECRGEVIRVVDAFRREGQGRR